MVWRARPEHETGRESGGAVNERWVTLACLLSLPLARSEASDPQDEPARIRAAEEEEKKKEKRKPGKA